MSEPSVKLRGIVPDRLRPRSAKILLDSLEVQSDIGFHDFEIGSPQRLLVTVEIWLDHIPAADCDDPAEAWDYDLLREQIVALTAQRRYNLQESLAHAIYDRVASMRGVRALRVATSKPDVYPNAKGVGVEIASYREPEGD
ncbi:MAG TPA: dihydroneopterin aldolase [Sphingomicrobium sp.]|nr:dihydroneopterin aldolase [Sphingomicrobium sp.]